MLWIFPFQVSPTLGITLFDFLETHRRWLKHSVSLCICGSPVFTKDLGMPNNLHSFVFTSICLGGIWEGSWCPSSGRSHQTWAVTPRVQSKEGWLWTGQEAHSTWEGDTLERSYNLYTINMILRLHYVFLNTLIIDSVSYVSVL